MNKINLPLFLIFLVVFISGCNGTSGKNEVAVTAVASQLTVSLTDSSGVTSSSFDNQSPISVNVVVYDQDDTIMSGVKVSIVTDLGDIAVDSGLTDSNGSITFLINNEFLAVGAGTITVTSGDVSSDVLFEYVSHDVAIQPALINTQLMVNNSSVNQFKADQSALIMTTLMSADNQPLANEIITFTADLGSMSTTTALTNENGVATISLSGDNTIGAGVLTASFTEKNGNIVSSQMNYEIIAADVVVVDNDIRIGYHDNAGDFVEGKIELSTNTNTLSAGGTLGLSVDLVDSSGALITTPTAVSFTSNCVTSDHATVDSSVFTVNGTATATFEDVDCAGISGIDDVLLATITVNGVTKTASETLSITGEQLGSIEFVSAQPNAIVLKGTGGQGKQEVSTITFLVKSALGNPVSQQTVNFSLDTDVGNITLNPSVGVTNSQGLISTQVISGTVPTTVRVSASATLNNTTINSQSDLLSVNTGLPEQRSMTLSVSVPNPEADQNDGETSEITAWLADNFNNPVPDGTAVNFTTEGGNIDASCVTVNGRCSVTWYSSEPRVADHRVTILATAIGHETFFDTNGNNVFDENDGMAITSDGVSSGFERMSAQSSGFIDMTEAWRDDNENRQYDSGELFIDFDNNGVLSPANNVFNGPQCTGSLCGTKTSTTVRKATVIVMSGSIAKYSLENTTDNTLYSDSDGNGSGIPAIADGNSLPITLLFSDLADQPLPVDTTVSVSLGAGEIDGTTSYRMPKTNSNGSSSINFVINNPVGGDPENATLTIVITTPKGVVTNIIRTVVLQ